ncbi:MAG TPA: acylphosphatase [Micromonosporaceae bacterium]
MTRTRVVVGGLVQGVFFRDTCRRVAVEHRLAGWVRNLPDGTVEAVFEGEPDRVAAAVDWIRRGPPHADVTDVAVHEEPPEGLVGFEIRPTPRWGRRT